MFLGPGEEGKISVEGGIEPLRAHSGRELFHRDGEKMMAVDIKTSPVFQARTPHPLFTGPYRRVDYVNDYDLTADDQRFLTVQPSTEEPSPLQLNVVLHWFEELKQKVPSGK